MTTEKKIDPGTRIGSMLLDHIIMTVVIMVFSIPGMIRIFLNDLDPIQSRPNVDFWGNTIYVMLVGFALYFCKDSFDGRSPGKRTLKLQVVTNDTGKAASPVKCFVRNIFMMFWPIEALVTLFSPARRLGDLVAGTKVLMHDESRPPEKTDWTQVGIAIALAYGFMLLLMTPYFIIMSSLANQK